MEYFNRISHVYERAGKIIPVVPVCPGAVSALSRSCPADFPVHGGGIGFAKTGGNYAASILAGDIAEKKGYEQVLWLDGVERRYIEEVGTMNVFFRIGDEIVTPALQGSILPGITRMSCIELLRSWGYQVTERKLAIDELYEAYQKGQLKEAFGSGTAAVISPIGQLKWGDEIMMINNGEIGEVSQKLYDNLTGIQWGKLPDTMGWTVEVK